MLSVFLQRKSTINHQNMFLDAFRTNSRNIIGRNPSMVPPLLANQDLKPMLFSFCTLFKSMSLYPGVLRLVSISANLVL